MLGRRKDTKDSSTRKLKAVESLPEDPFVEDNYLFSMSSDAFFRSGGGIPSVIRTSGEQSEKQKDSSSSPKLLDRSRRFASTSKIKYSTEPTEKKPFLQPNKYSRRYSSPVMPPSMKESRLDKVDENESGIMSAAIGLSQKKKPKEVDIDSGFFGS